jgi:hypothetical protein
MNDDTTIVLELTPREAAVLLELTSVVSWSKGDYGEEVEAICRALEEVLPDGVAPWSMTCVGCLEPGQVFLVDQPQKD